MNIENLLLTYLDFRISKRLAVKNLQWDIAADCRDKERELSKQIALIINPELQSFDVRLCESLIEYYCINKYNSSIFDADVCKKSILRILKINDLID